MINAFVTRPLVKVLRIVDGEKKPHVGYIYEVMDRAKETIAKSSSMKKKEYNKAFGYIDRRWDCQLHKPLHALGYFLNMELHYDNPETSTCDEVIKSLYDRIARLNLDIETQDKIIIEIKLYRNAHGPFGLPATIRQRKTRSPSIKSFNTTI
ncbi:hypothetical protein GQ457_08G018720 [Hibiscus cannabinus]